MNDITIDLETLSTHQNAAILSIGAVVFDRVTGELGDRFYATVDIDSAIANGHVLGSTLSWWMQQNEAAKCLFDVSEKWTLGKALFDLSIFVRERAGARVWGNGSTFDISVLEHAYARVGLPAPWPFWDIRDMRTIVEAATAVGFDKRSVAFQGTKHNAGDDAAHQARIIAGSWAVCGGEQASAATRDVLAERQRQISAEGYGSYHDDEYSKGVLAAAAGCYALFSDASPNAGQPPPAWPWDSCWWKPKDYRSDLVRAAALLLAEIERFDRAAARVESCLQTQAGDALDVNAEAAAIAGKAGGA